MNFTTQITRTFNDNTVQVEIKSKKGDNRYYKVPADKADSFQKEYVKNSKKSYNKSLIANFLAAVGAVGVALVATESMTNKLWRGGISLVSGLIIGSFVSITGHKIAVKSHKEMLDKYNASELHYDNKKLPI